MVSLAPSHPNVTMALWVHEVPQCHKGLPDSAMIKKLCINIEQCLLNTPGNICLHSKEGIEVRTALTASICNRDLGKGQGQRIQLKDSENSQNHIITESLGFKIKTLKFNPCPTTPYGTTCHIHSFLKTTRNGDSPAPGKIIPILYQPFWKTFYLISKLYFLGCSLRLCPLVLSVPAWRRPSPT